MRKNREALVFLTSGSVGAAMYWTEISIEGNMFNRLRFKTCPGSENFPLLLFPGALAKLVKW